MLPIGRDWLGWPKPTPAYAPARGACSGLDAVGGVAGFLAVPAAGVSSSPAAASNAAWRLNSLDFLGLLANLTHRSDLEGFGG